VVTDLGPFSARLSERRIGQRVPTPGLALGWHPPPPKKRFGRSKELDLRCQVLDVSVTGMGVVAPDAGEVKPGSLVVVDLDGEETNVQVRRMRPRGDGTCFYGVVFIRLGSRLQAEVEAVVTAARSR